MIFFYTIIDIPFLDSETSTVSSSDLHDFAKGDFDYAKTTKTRITSTHSRKPTGRLINHNKKEIALFRYGQDVFAIDEKCPHVGMYVLNVLLLK